MSPKKPKSLYPIHINRNIWIATRARPEVKHHEGRPWTAVYGHHTGAISVRVDRYGQLGYPGYSLASVHRPVSVQWSGQHARVLGGHERGLGYLPVVGDPGTDAYGLFHLREDSAG